MWALLLVLIVLLFVINKSREHFGLVIGTGEYGYTTDTDTNDGIEIFSTTPHTCPQDRPELDAGLCYVRCREGYRGVGPVCWARTVGIGIGKPIGLEPCPAGWSNDGLICRQPLKWNSCSWKLFGMCIGGLEGGRLRGRLNNGGICDWPQDRGNLPSWLVDKSDPKNYKATHPDRVDGLCYRQCPKDYPKHLPGMPYLCFKGGPLAYGRGVGRVPSLVRVGRVWNPF